MQRFDPIKYPDAGTPLAEMYKMIVEGGGQGAEEGVPTNYVTSMGQRPDLLGGVMGMAGAIFYEGQIPMTVKQMIGMAIAILHDCRYCATGTRRALEAMGVPVEVIESCASDPEFSALPPSQRAILKFALKADKSAASLTDDDFQTMYDFGFSEEEVIEILMIVASARFNDFWADVSQISLDGEEEAVSAAA